MAGSGDVLAADPNRFGILFCWPLAQTYQGRALALAVFRYMWSQRVVYSHIYALSQCIAILSPRRPDTKHTLTADHYHVGAQPQHSHAVLFD